MELESTVERDVLTAARQMVARADRRVEELRAALARALLRRHELIARRTQEELELAERELVLSQGRYRNLTNRLLEDRQ